MISSGSMRALFVCLVLAAGGCNGHRLGFFGDEEGSEGGEGTTTTGPEPTTLSPTTVGTITTPVPTTDPGSGPTSDPSSDPTLGPTTTVDPSEPGTVTITSDPTIPDPSDSETEGTLCGETWLPQELPVTVPGENNAHPDLFMHSCVLGNSSPDAVWIWTPPQDAVVEFNTEGSGFDTVMSVFAGVCGGQELGCNDDGLGLASRVTAEVTAGVPVTIVVEGLGGQVGPILLNIVATDEPPPPVCAVIDLGSEFVAVDGDTQLGTNEHASGCGGDQAPEQAFLWRAPFAGSFSFRTFGSSHDPLLYVRAGDCDGLELGCNDDFDNLESRVDVSLAPEDGSVVVIVDGALASAGTFTLEIVPN